tara:strand:- start:172 stop:612 length:441 start_codon:yes stop_codon:yes gene_type:complete
MDQPPLPPQILPIEARWCLEHPPSLCIDLEVADQPDEQRLGLMQRPALSPLRGMWFPARPARPMRFWMHNTLAPLDMVFVRDGRVLDIAANVPVCRALPCPSYWADADGNGRADFADGVIEIGAGEAERLRIRAGHAVVIERISLD